MASRAPSTATAAPSQGQSSPPPLSGFPAEANSSGTKVVGLRDIALSEEDELFLVHSSTRGGASVQRRNDASVIDLAGDEHPPRDNRRGRDDDEEVIFFFDENAASTSADLSHAMLNANHRGREATSSPRWEEEEEAPKEESPKAQPREKFEHEQDHDSCTFMTVRKSEWFIKFLDHIHRTSPLDPAHLLASFSIKNDFMFYPPPKTYCFVFEETGNITVGESGNRRRADGDEDTSATRELPASTKRRIRRPRVAYEARPQINGRKPVGATHGIGGMESYAAECSKLSRFEMAFIPWKNEIQTYRIVKDEVILEKKITVGGPLFPGSLGCPIPCSIIRPACRMSSHIAIFFHCNGEDIGHSSCMRLQTLANALHVTVLVPEYPGYGLFRGSTSEASVKGAMERVVQFLLTVDASLTPSRLLLIGHSIGGAVAMHIAAYIQEVFERLQGHYESDVACPGAYSNELADQGKPTFFEAFQVSPGSNAADTVPNTNQPPRRTVPNVSFADDDCDTDDEKGDDDANGMGGEDARLRRENQNAYKADANLAVDYRMTPRLNRTSPQTFSPAAVSNGRSTNEPYGTDYEGADEDDPPMWSTTCRVVQERNDNASPQPSAKRGSSQPLSSRTRPPQASTSSAHQQQRGAAKGSRDHLCGTSSSTNNSAPAKGSELAGEGSRNRHHNPSTGVTAGNDTSDDEESAVSGCCSCRGCGGHQSRPKRSTVTHCRHNALGGIILVSSFTALRCVEYVPTFKHTYKLHSSQLELRRRQVPCDTVYAAPTHWCEDASERVPPEDLDFFYEESTTPLIFKLSRFISFNRFPTVDVMCRLQEKYQFFNHTPLLLVHGTDDRLISPIHSVALASKLRQCKNGGTKARVFLSFLSGGGHNELPCIGEIRRFYKDEILIPHLQRQQHFKKKLAELYEAGRDKFAPASLRDTQVTKAHSPDDNTSAKEGSHGGGSASSPQPPAELYFLSHDPTIVASTHKDSSVAKNRGSSHTAAGPARPSTDRAGNAKNTPRAPSNDPADTVAGTREKDIYGPFIRHEPSPTNQNDDGNPNALNTALLHTIEQTQGTQPRPDEAAFAPAATVIHMSMIPLVDNYDVGSVLVAAVRTNALSKHTANTLYTRHYRQAWGWRIIISSVFLAAGMVVLCVGMTHAILCRPDKLRGYIPAGHNAADYKRDNRILAWCVAETITLAIIFVLRMLTPMFGLSNISKERERHRLISFKIFAVLNFVSVFLAVGFGIIMAFILVFTPGDRGGVDWGKWADLPYNQRVWISHVPRWLMMGIACWHCLVLLFVVLKNH